jgi:hypothetical protein
MADEKEKKETKDAKEVKGGKSYLAKHPVRHHGRHYAPGKKLQLTAEQAAPLLESGYVEELPAGTPDAAPAATPETK